MKMYNKSIVNAKQRHNDTVETLFANHEEKKFCLSDKCR